MAAHKLIAFCLSMAALPAAAIAQGDVSSGEAIASARCASCHAMPDDIDTGVADSLSDIAQTQQDWTSIDLRVWLPVQHGAKANIVITSQDGYQLARYLEQLSSGAGLSPAQ